MFLISFPHTTLSLFLFHLHLFQYTTSMYKKLLKVKWTQWWKLATLLCNWMTIMDFFLF